jgi:hypothetical protein
MHIRKRISAPELDLLRQRAKEAYWAQYHSVTPEIVLHSWVHKEYQKSEWLKAGRQLNQGFRFLCQGNYPHGYLRFSKNAQGISIDKIWMDEKSRKRKYTLRLLKTLALAPLSIKIYAGNIVALRAFRKMGFFPKSDCTFSAKGFAQSGRILYRDSPNSVSI